MNHLPELALAIKQPWAWAVIHGGKDLENRTANALRLMIVTPHALAVSATLFGRRAIHASVGMTREDYDSAKSFMLGLGVVCPPPAELKRGGLIGSVNVAAVVKRSSSPWFMGPRALVLTDPEPCDFVPVVGALGYFLWAPADYGVVPQPARWMLPKAPAPVQEPLALPAPEQPGLFD